MDKVEALILGIVQGITEWLPVSSSGHLVLFQHFFSLKEQLVFDVSVHLGTMIVVVWMFRADLMKIISGVLHEKWDDANQGFQMAKFVLIASIPTALIGFMLKDTIEQMFDDPSAVGIALMYTSVILYITRFIPERQPEQRRNPKWYHALIVGTFQGTAIFPGVSRSGSTIASALFVGLDRNLAARLSFLMFIPAMLGATLIQLPKLSEPNISYSSLIVGTLAAIVTSYFVIAWLLTIIRNGKLYMFAYYCGPVGLLSWYFLR